MACHRISLTPAFKPVRQHFKSFRGGLLLITGLKAGVNVTHDSSLALPENGSV